MLRGVGGGGEGQLDHSNGSGDTNSCQGRGNGLGKVGGWVLVFGSACV